MTNQATQAVYASKHKHIWGRDAALRYAINQGVHPSLYRLACFLYVVDKLDNPIKPQAL